jgi:RNA polymerase sigma-70 factor (ECF subfamily)
METPRTPTKPGQALSDNTLMRRIRLGDTAAFESVFREHYGNLCDFVDGYVRSRTDAEQIVEDVFYTFWLRRAEWRPTSTVRAALFAAAHIRALGWRRRSALERGIDADSLGEVLHTHRLDPGHGAEATEEARRLHTAIASLPERARLAVRLRWLERMQYAEIAEAMGVSVKGVEKLVNSALHALRSALDPHPDH